MIVKYNSLNRLEKPKLILCNPGSVCTSGVPSKILGVLSDHEAEEVVFNFNATSELNFRVNKLHHDDPEEDEYTRRIFELIQNRRLIFMEDVGYFVITHIKNGYGGGIHYKDVKAESIDVEIQQKKIPYIENNTYRFSTDQTGTNKGILETIVEVIPLWTIGEVDSAVASKWRTFEDVDTTLNCLGFLIDSVQDAYECIFVFDTINRVINVYDQNNYVNDTDIHITKDDVINSIDITEDANDLYTAISVLGDEENVTIAPINPLGTSVIYNFDYYLDWMSEPLRERVVSWQNAVKTARDSYYALNLEYYTNKNSESILSAEVARLNMLKDMYQRCRDNIVAESSTKRISSYNETIAQYSGSAIISNEIEDAKAEIKALINGRGINDGETQQEYDEAIAGARDKYTAKLNVMIDPEYVSPIDYSGYNEDDIGCVGMLRIAEAMLESIREDIEEEKDDINEVHESLSITRYFTKFEYEELYQYIFEGSYQDEYVVITDGMTYSEKFKQMKILFDRAEFQLEKVSKPTQEFDIDAENFIFIKEFERWSAQLETGCLINAELKEDDIAKLFLSSISINYDDHKLNLTFGNRFNKFDPKSLFDNILGGINKSANTLNYVKDVLYPIKSGEFSEMRDRLRTSRNISMANALASEGQEVTIDDSGYTGKVSDPDSDDGYEPYQVKLTGSNLVFTDDSWDSSKVAIGKIYLGNIIGDGDSPDNYKYGVNAEYLVGDIIIGSQLHITDGEKDILEVMDDKVNARVSGLEGQVATLSVESDNISGRISTLEEKDGEVDHVITTNGFTFNQEGLNIWREGSEIKNKLDETGMYVKKTGGDNGEDTDVLTANNEGVNAINLTARKYLTIGKYSRFEDYSTDADSRRTACFFIGDDISEQIEEEEE